MKEKLKKAQKVGRVFGTLGDSNEFGLRKKVFVINQLDQIDSAEFRKQVASLLGEMSFDLRYVEARDKHEVRAKLDELLSVPVRHLGYDVVLLWTTDFHPNNEEQLAERLGAEVVSNYLLTLKEERY